MTPQTGTAVPAGSASFPLRILPVRAYGTGKARRIVERNVVAYTRRWWILASGFFEPLFYLLSIGLGLNHLVGQIRLGGRPLVYAAYVAPGLLASSAMNGALFDSTFNIFFKLKIAKTYDAVLATPIGVRDIALGEVTWSIVRGAIYSFAFLVVMASMGLVLSWWAILCFPAALVVSFAFAGAGMGATCYMRRWQDFDYVSLASIPMFLFSAVFYPLTVYPGWLQVVVSCTPLYQGVDMLRELDAGLLTPALLGHAAALIAFGVGGMLLAARRLGMLLRP
ncbi:MAG: ABC transporter permease [Acidimicrobiales bacterium]